MDQTIRQAVAAALDELGAPSDFSLEHPTELSHGDYATNAALAAAKTLGKIPREVAEMLVARLNIPGVASIEVAGPGFINFRLERSFFVRAVEIALKEKWGWNDAYVGKTVLVEYTDPNPFKEFHVGHLFTNTVGESIARLFMAAGADVKRVNYQGDVGMHVAKAVWGLQKLSADSTSLTPTLLGKAYATGAAAYEEGAKEDIQRINKALYERSDDELNALYDAGRQVSLDYFETIYKVLGTQFDHYFFESEAAPRGKELVLTHPQIFPESEGARIFRGEEHGLHTRVFLNAEGLPTYEAKELALAKMKAEVYPYDHSVVSTSAEINEYFKVLKTAMGSVYPELAEKTEHIGHGTVRLAEGKMSSRTGNIISAVDFIDEMEAAVYTKATESEKGQELSGHLATAIAVGAIKYAILKSNIFQDSIFNKEQALSLEGDSGPYLQYAHARICSVLDKASREGITPSCEQYPEDLADPEALLYRFPEVLRRALEERTPHHVAQYLTELVSSFNSWYAKETIVNAKDSYSPYKVAVSKAVAQTLKDGLWVLGIEAPERM